MEEKTLRKSANDISLPFVAVVAAVVVVAAAAAGPSRE